MEALELAFWMLLVAGIYPYAIYPVMARVLGRLRNHAVRKDAGYAPRVSIITSAYNESLHIGPTILNKLSQEYPAGLIEVIVVSDGSDDGTDEIVTELSAADSRVRLLRQSPRQGKTAALNRAVAVASGEILVFADANSLYRPDTVRCLVANFADPSVGYVTGKMVYANADGSLVGDGCSAYMRLENALRESETRIGSIVGVDGGVDAVRARLFQAMRADQLPDFVLPLSVVEQGYRVVFEPAALLMEESLTTETSEYQMRVRVALRALWALRDKSSLLNPFARGLFSWQLASHKLLRYLSFLPLAVAALVNWFLLGYGVVYQAALACQLAFVAMIAVAAWGPRTLRKVAVVRYAYYFALLNWASAVACARFLRGQKQVLWQPRVG